MKIEKYGTVPQLVNAYVTKLKVMDVRRAEQKRKREKSNAK